MVDFTRMSDVERIEQILRREDPNLATPERCKWLAELEEIYEREGVLSGGVPAPALHVCCASKDACWKNADGRRPGPLTADDDTAVYGSIFWPWIGSRYQRGGVCFVSLNLNLAVPDDDGSWSIAFEYRLAKWVASAFADGDRTPFRGSSLFSERWLAAASAVLTSLDGGEPQEELASLPAGIEAMERTARVQTVKCSPTGTKSEPEPAMRRECPARFAIPELKVLQPGTIVGMGNPAWDAIQGLSAGGAQWEEPPDSPFNRGTVELQGRVVNTLWTCHPSYFSGWPRSLQALVANLRERPLRAAG